jgi:predicted RNase H-like nuclease (RuvC/YqgF family)
MKAHCEKLEQEIRRLEGEIEEQRLRIPPHSVNPAMLMELEELEDRRDQLRAELTRCLASEEK